MPLTFSKIFIKEEIFKDYKTENDDEVISNFSRINLFIGANNSGKSRFLRSIMSNKNLKFEYQELDSKIINLLIRNYNNKIKDFVNRYIRKEQYDAIFLFATAKEVGKYLTVGLDFESVILNALNNVITHIDTYRLHLINSIPYGEKFSTAQEFLKGVAEENLPTIKAYLKNTISIKDHNWIYIPTLRGLRTYSVWDKEANGLKAKNVYLDRTHNDYFKENEEVYTQIKTGLDIYDDIKKLLLSADREKVKKFEKFLSESFFNNKDVNLVPHIEDDSLHVKIGEDERPIYNLGDGIQAIIILTYPLFFNEKENLKVFIEEPELNLHPGLQRILIETLLRPEFKDYQYFITTHSNHFLDITLDIDKISVYTFSKETDRRESKFIITNVENDDSEILSLIGVKNASVFLSNCTIWVEGITDRIYLRKYLELYQHTQIKSFKEDTHFSFVEYGGNNITHWSFLDDQDEKNKNINVDRLCGKLMLISDSDGAGMDTKGNPQKKKEKKYVRFQQLKAKLGDRYCLLTVREIENLLTKEIIEKVVSENEKNNQLDFSKFDKQKLKQQPIGKYINDKVVGVERDYASDSGSIKDKVNFAKKAVAKMKSLSDMSEEAIELTQKVYHFIKSQNQ